MLQSPDTGLRYAGDYSQVILRPAFSFPYPSKLFTDWHFSSPREWFHSWLYYTPTLTSLSIPVADMLLLTSQLCISV